MADESDTDLLELTATIVSAHIRNNQVAPDLLPELIQSVHRSLAMAGTAKPARAPAPPVPPVPIRKSVFPHYIVCLENGKKLKMLTRHLRVSYGMTPEHYRQKWGLPSSYPMVAPDCTRRRSNRVRQNSLYRKPESPALEQVNLTKKNGKPDLPAEPPVTQGRAQRARGSKS